MTSDQFLWRTVPQSTPDLVEPAIVMDGLGARVVLLNVQAELGGEGVNPVPGSVNLRGFWDGRPMKCDFVGDCTVLPSAEPSLLRIKDDTTGAMAEVPVRALSVELQPTLFGDVIEASLTPLASVVKISYGQEDDTTKEVIAHLLNLPQYDGELIQGAAVGGTLKISARLRFTGGGWRVTIDGMLPWVYQYAFDLFDKDSLEDAKRSELWKGRFEALKQAPHTGGAILTHVLRLERENGSTFGLKRAVKILDRLETFLSFVFGRRTRPLHVYGYDGYRSQKWTLLDVQPLSSTPLAPGGIPPWIPQPDASMDGGTSPGVNLSAAFKGLVSLAEDPGTLVTLNRAIDWYSAALAFFGNPASIVLAQAGLELLAWRRITTEMKLSEKGRLNLDAADQLRLLLAGTELPLDVPDELSELSNSRISGPVAVTRARNAAVHPVDNSGLTKAQSNEAQALAIWYLEMLLLRMLGHDGEYWDRLGKENRIVPWR